MDERDKHWSMIVHGDGSKHLRIEECHKWRFQNFEATIMLDEDVDKIYKEIPHKFVHR
jgi:hypothetical protein